MGVKFEKTAEGADMPWVLTTIPTKATNPPLSSVGSVATLQLVTESKVENTLNNNFRKSKTRVINSTHPLWS